MSQGERPWDGGRPFRRAWWLPGGGRLLLEVLEMMKIVFAILYLGIAALGWNLPDPIVGGMTVTGCAAGMALVVKAVED